MLRLNTDHPIRNKGKARWVSVLLISSKISLNDYYLVGKISDKRINLVYTSYQYVAHGYLPTI